MNIILAICWTAFVLWIVFKTSAVYEYLRLLPFCDRFTRIKEYGEFRKHDMTMGYGEFMYAKCPSFFVRMCRCPFCVGVWVAFAGCIVFDCFSLLPAVYGTAFILYFVFSWTVKRLKDE